MNCKQGDVAIIVRSMAGNEGKIVTCVRFVPNVLYTDPILGDFEADSWEIDAQLLGPLGLPAKFAPDAWLKPLRDDPGQDETLQWAPVPSKKETVK